MQKIPLDLIPEEQTFHFTRDDLGKLVAGIRAEGGGGDPPDQDPPVDQDPPAGDDLPGEEEEPALSGIELLNREGVVHRSTSAKLVEELKIRPPAGRYRSIELDVDVEFDRWNSENGKDDHGVVQLQAKRWREGLLSYVMVSPAGIVMKANLGQSEDKRRSRPAKDRPPGRYHLKTLFNAGKSTTTWEDLGAAKLTRVSLDGLAEEVVIDEGDELVILLGTETATKPNAPEVHTAGWRWSNLVVRAVPVGAASGQPSGSGSDRDLDPEAVIDEAKRDFERPGPKPSPRRARSMVSGPPREARHAWVIRFGIPHLRGEFESVESSFNTRDPDVIARRVARQIAAYPPYSRVTHYGWIRDWQIKGWGRANFSETDIQKTVYPDSIPEVKVGEDWICDRDDVMATNFDDLWQGLQGAFALEAIRLVREHALDPDFDRPGQIVPALILDTAQDLMRRQLFSDLTEDRKTRLVKWFEGLQR